jgi:hypothetical protein
VLEEPSLSLSFVMGNLMESQVSFPLEYISQMKDASTATNMNANQPRSQYPVSSANPSGKGVTRYRTSE